MLVNQLKNNKSLPIEFISLLPEVCNGILGMDNTVLVPCNYPFEITETLSRLQCANKKCPNITLKRILGFSSIVGLDSITMEVAKDIIKTWGITNVFELFMYEPSDGKLSGKLNFEESLEIHKQISELKGITVTQYIVLSQIEELNTEGSIRFISKFSTIAEIYEGLEEEGLKFIINTNRECTEKFDEEDKEYANEIYESMISGNFIKIQKFANEIGNSNILDLANNIKERGLDFILSELNIAKNPNKGDFNIEDIRIYRALIDNREYLTECLDYINFKQ